MSKNKGKGSKKWCGVTKKIIHKEIDYWNRTFVEEGIEVRMKMIKPGAKSEKSK